MIRVYQNCKNDVAFKRIEGSYIAVSTNIHSLEEEIESVRKAVPSTSVLVRSTKASHKSFDYKLAAKDKRESSDDDL